MAAGFGVITLGLVAALTTLFLIGWVWLSVRAGEIGIGGGGMPAIRKVRQPVKFYAALVAVFCCLIAPATLIACVCLTLVSMGLTE